jgi:hypothetical protein
MNTRPDIPKETFYKTAQRKDNGEFIALDYMGKVDKCHCWIGKDHKGKTIKLFYEYELDRFTL